MLVPTGELVCMMNSSRKVLDVTSPLKKQFLVALIAVVGCCWVFLVEWSTRKVLPYRRER